MLKKIASLASIAILASGVAAQGAIITLNNGGSVSPTTTGNFGTITLTQNVGSVTLSESLASNEYFLTTGAGDALAFNLAGSPSLASVTTAIGSSLTSGYLLGGADSASPFGNYAFTILCDSACNSGGSAGLNANDHSFSFTLTGFTLDDFGVLSDASNHGPTAAYFASDICVEASGTGCIADGGGNVAATSFTSTPATPEPSSLIMLGTGIVSAAGLMRRRFVN
jgi:hypothetical protein